MGVLLRLRGPGGCKWDRGQTAEDLKTFILEEAYETLEALDGPDPARVCEELGDLCYQVLFLSDIFARRGRFTLADVLEGIAGKLVRRHPHVFGTVRVRSKEEILRNWERIKQDEKQAAGSGSTILSGVPPRLPALLRALRLTSKAARVGFDWARAGDVLKKLKEELGELQAARRARRARREKIREEMGDVLFVLANLARKLGVDPEEALRQANLKFERRFAHVERRLAAGGRRPQDSTLAEMDRLWEESKRIERKKPVRRPRTRR